MQVVNVTLLLRHIGSQHMYGEKLKRNTEQSIKYVDTDDLIIEC